MTAKKDQKEREVGELLAGVAAASPEGRRLVDDLKAAQEPPPASFLQDWRDYDYVAPPMDVPKGAYGPEELNRRMTVAQFEHDHACREMAKLEVAVTTRRKKTMVILSSRRFELIQNERLRQHLVEIFLVDPKFRITKELYDTFIYLEHEEMSAKYHYYETMAATAKDDHEMLQKQLSWYQSILKRETAELMGSNRTGGA
jgi:hypothetical protein